jgi:predicted transcriptional regulator
MTSKGGFHDLLFELSNEYRYGILIILRNKEKRITELSREVELTFTEVRRHVARLSEAGLIKRDLDGYYHLTEIGKIVLLEIQEFDLITRYKAYLNSHTLKDLPTEFIKRLGDLNESRYVGNIVDFIRQTESIITDAREYVWLLVDQLPIHNLSSILNAIERGVEFKIIEPNDRVLNPDIDSLTSEEIKALANTRQTPLTEQRMRDEVNVFLILSEKKCALSLPTFEGVFDYNGFVATDERALGFCRDVFNHFWREAELRISSHPKEVERGPLALAEDLGQVIVVGCEDPDVDAQAVQDAVDNYDHVILRGSFNFGVSSVLISRSVVIRGEGQENDIPTANIYKKGWVFPFREWDSVFQVNDENIDVTIENILFTDFNGAYIWGHRGNNLYIKNNRITLPTGYGRGVTYGRFGDIVMGIWVEGNGGFRGKVTIEENYLDFASEGGWPGFHSRDGLEEDPEYRPNLFNHEYFVSVGITVNSVAGNVSVENNIIRNTNARGIIANSNLASADVQIRHNTIESDVYGSYPISSPEAGAGILAISAWGLQDQDSM